jgi:putative DNA primase/helicase
MKYPLKQIFYVNHPFFGHERFKTLKIEADCQITKGALVLIGIKSKEINDYVKEEIIKPIEEEKPNKLLMDETAIQLIVYGDQEETKRKTMQELSSEIILLISIKQRSEATEKLVNFIEDNNHIYTTRDDIKSEVWIYRDGIYIPQGKTYIKEKCRKILKQAFTTHICNDVINKIEADTYIDQDEFFNTNYVNEVAVKNGILDILRKKTYPFTPTKIFFNKLPVTYDDSKGCPAIKKHFKTVLKSKEDIPLIQELFGYLLLKDYKIETAIMLNGSGRNGKSKTIELMKNFLGVANTVSIPLQQLEQDQFAICNLFGKMANMCADISKNAIENTGRFKEATGRDEITAPRKFMNPIKFKNYAKMIFSCNELPSPKDLSPAFFERWQYLEFPYTFKTQQYIDSITDNKEKAITKLIDPDIVEKLTTTDELSGLLNWALDGLKRLLKQNAFSTTNTWQDVKGIWMRKSNSLYAFVTDCIVEDWDSKIIKSDFRKAYVMYCKKHKITSYSDKFIHSNLPNIVSVVEERFMKDGEYDRCWVGISFKEHIEDEFNQLNHPFRLIGQTSNLDYSEKKVVKVVKSDKIIYKNEKSEKKNNSVFTKKWKNEEKKIINYLEKNIKNNSEYIDSHFDKKIIDYLKKIGDIIEIPKGTYKYIE